MMTSKIDQMTPCAFQRNSPGSCAKRGLPPHLLLLRSCVQFPTALMLRHDQPLHVIMDIIFVTGVSAVELVVAVAVALGQT